MSAEAGVVYQLKIKLKHITPPIWRRVDVPAKITLGELHDVIQIVMGWHGEHMHQFIFGQRRDPTPDEMRKMRAGGDFPQHERFYSDPEMEMEDTEDEHAARLNELAQEAGTKFRYEYDFGDSWEHEVVVEKIKPAEPGVKYPVCTGGRRAGPVEDCGGPWGWEELLEAVNDPKHPDHAEKREWLGMEKKDVLDGEAFDLEEINALLRGEQMNKGGDEVERRQDSPAELLPGPDGLIPGTSLRLVSYDVSFEPLKDPKYDLPEDIAGPMNELYPRISEEPREAIRILEGWLERYPTAARLLNYLNAAYLSQMPEKARETAERNYRENPDYLFAKLNYAEIFLQERNFEKIKEIFGDKWELSMHDPGRKQFHVTEVLSFAAIVGRYLAGIGKLEAAEVYLEMIEEVAPDSPEAEALEWWIQEGAMEQAMMKMVMGRRRKKTEKKKRKH